MNRVLFLVLISLLVSTAISQAISGFEFVGPMTKTGLQCLRTNTPRISLIIVRIYKISGTPGMDQAGVETVNIASTIRPFFYTDVYVEVCRSADPTTIGTALGLAYPSGSLPFYGLSVKVQSNSVAGCTWTGYTQTQNCVYLTALIRAINIALYGRGIVHIASTAYSWKSLLGNTCNNFASSYLWYANYNKKGQLNTQVSYADFIPFGGWTAPNFKTTANSVRLTLCNNPAWRVLGNMILATI